MEKQISLDLLINYLTNNSCYKEDSILSDKENIVEDKFNLKYLEYFNSKNFNLYNEYFKTHIDRVGVYVHSDKNSNISLLTSILFCIDEDFCTLSITEQDFYIKTLNKKIISDIVNRNFKIKNISKQMLITNLKNKKVSNELDIYIYASYFNINIFTFDFLTNSIVSYYQEEEFNVYKKNVFLSKHEFQFNPLVYKNNNGSIFKYNSSILEDILYSSKINVFSFNEKEFIICNNWDILLSKYKDVNLSSIIVDLNKEKSFLLKQMIDSDESEDNKKMENLEYDTDDSNHLENDLNFDNLTEELENINKETQDIEEINSDDLILDDNSEEDLKLDKKDILIDDTLLSKLKNMSESKLLKEKKDVLVNYLVTLFNKSKNEFSKKTKKDLVDNLKLEINKTI